MSCLVLFTFAIGVALVLDYRQGHKKTRMIDGAKLIQGLRK